jgi:hypothetical protein
MSQLLSAIQLDEAKASLPELRIHLLPRMCWYEYDAATIDWRI